MSQNTSHLAVFTNTNTNDASHWAKIIFDDMREKLSTEGDTFAIDTYVPTNKRGTAVLVSDVIKKSITDSGLDNTTITSLCRSVLAHPYIFEGDQIVFGDITTDAQKRVEFDFDGKAD